MAKNEVTANEVPLVRNYFDRSVRPKIICPPEEGRTKQSFKDECDINILLAKYDRNTLLLKAARDKGVYGDFSDVPTYQEALDTIHQANMQFNLLPAKIRAAFDHDPAAFLAYATNPANAAGLVELGLATPKPGQGIPGRPKPGGLDPSVLKGAGVPPAGQPKSSGEGSTSG